MVWSRQDGGACDLVVMLDAFDVMMMPAAARLAHKYLEVTGTGLVVVVVVVRRRRRKAATTTMMMIVWWWVCCCQEARAACCSVRRPSATLTPAWSCCTETTRTQVMNEAAC